MVLRALIIFVMVRALLRREYQSMALCGLSLFLMILPSIVSRRLKVVLPSTLEIIICCLSLRQKFWAKSTAST